MPRPLILALFSLALAFGADHTGTYHGSILVQTPDGEREMRGAIIMKQEGEKLSISAGPDTAQQHPASDIKLEGEKLTFALASPNGEGDPWKFDCTLSGGKLAGTVTLSRNGETRTGKLEMKKE